MEFSIRRMTPGWRATRFAGLLGTTLALLVVSMLVLLGPGTGPAQARFELGLQDDGFGPDATVAQARAALSAMNGIHGRYVRVGLNWANLVSSPGSRQVPSGFNQANPADRHYNWAKIDQTLRYATSHHWRVILDVARAPAWAEGPPPVKPYVSEGAWNPNLTMVTQLIHAAAVRYSGRFPDPLHRGAHLPRVKYWEPWNEPNIPGYFSAPDTLLYYRLLLNDAYGQLKAVHRDNKVFLGGLAPVSPVPGSIPPLDFAASLMCLRHSGSRYVAIRRCRRARFDAVAIHPYSISATPTKHAFKPGDMLVGDIGRVRGLIRAAGNRYPLWVTEFNWFTNPTNTTFGDAPATAARYVAYSMYEMWRAGTSVVIWFTALELNHTDFFPGGGLYSASGQPKLVLNAFEFPFVAGRGWAWGRVPTSRHKAVVVERAAGRRWVRVATARTGSDGVFYVRFARRGGVYRARTSRSFVSLPYDSKPIPPRRTHEFNPS